MDELIWVPVLTDFNKVLEITLGISRKRNDFCFQVNLEISTTGLHTLIIPYLQCTIQTRLTGSTEIAARDSPDKMKLTSYKTSTKHGCEKAYV